MDQFRVGKVKDVGPGKTFYFKIQVQQYRSCLNLDANSYCYFALFIYINAGHILEFICICFFSLFSWLSCSDGKSLCYLILNMYASRFS